MRIFVITKRTLVIAAIVLIAVVAAVIIAIAVSDGNATAAGSMAVVEEYELEVLAGKNASCPSTAWSETTKNRPDYRCCMGR